MNSQPSVADWEHIVRRDLGRHLMPLAGPWVAYRPAEVTGLPEGAYAALTDSVGPIDLSGLLVVPAAVWPWPGWRRRSLCTALSVAGIGDEGVGLWVRALSAPGVRVRIPFGDIAAVEDQVGWSRREVAVSGPGGRLLVRCRDEGRLDADAWIGLLRMRAAPVPLLVPAPRPGRRQPRGEAALDSALCDAGEEVVSAGFRSHAQCAACLLAITTRELIIVQSRAERGTARRVIRRTLYLPRQSIQGTGTKAGTVCVRSADADVAVRLWSKKVAAHASSWLDQMLIDHERRA
jgi:hypothetical protein